MNIKIVIAITVFCLSPIEVFADWQAQLEAAFDYVETFDDNTGAWRGPGTNYYPRIVGGGNPGGAVVAPEQFTVFSGNSIEWSTYTTPRTNSEGDGSNSIDDFGSGTRWVSGSAVNSTSHRSLKIDYRDDVSAALPTQSISRFGFKIGTAPSDGYNDVYVFYMKKYPKGFFLYDPAYGGAQYNFFMKELLLGTGFKDIGQWGSDAETSTMSSTCAGLGLTYAAQTSRDYGANWIFFNVQGSSSQTLGVVASNGVMNTNECNYDGYTHSDALKQLTNPLDFQDEYLANEWVGIEYHYKMSSAPGVSDAEITIKLYNESGTKIAEQSWLNFIDFQERTQTFNHKINKFEFGGNAYSGSGYSPIWYTGTHNGGTSDHLIDTTADFNYDGNGTGDLIDNTAWVSNITDHSNGKVLSTTGTTVTAELIAGDENRWEDGDVYVILSGSAFPNPMMYMDDIIINGSEIAPTYFSLLNGGSTPTTKKSFHFPGMAAGQTVNWRSTP